MVVDLVLKPILFDFSYKKHVKQTNVFLNLVHKNYSMTRFTLGAEIRLKYFANRNLKMKHFGHMII